MCAAICMFLKRAQDSKKTRFFLSIRSLLFHKIDIYAFFFCLEATNRLICIYLYNVCMHRKAQRCIKANAKERPKANANFFTSSFFFFFCLSVFAAFVVRLSLFCARTQWLRAFNFLFLCFFFHLFLLFASSLKEKC